MNAEEERIEGQEVESLQGEESDFVEEADAENLTEVDDDDEDVCRVCRCPAEPGRPLFTPCKCSGSMGMTHQDCLTSWLEVTRGDVLSRAAHMRLATQINSGDSKGRCEICKTKFRFDPQYATDTPERLPAREVLLGLSSRFLAKWLPLALRVVVAASLWLIIAPLLTNYLYHGWMIRPSSIPTRWKYDMLLSDIVSGAVMASIIIVSFLSLMSFADFLRVHWQQAPREEEDRRDERQLQMPNHGANADGNDEDDGANFGDENAIDNEIGDYIEQHEPPDETPENEEIHKSNSFIRQGEESEEENAADAELRSQAAKLRDLALELEVRERAAAAEREWIPLNDYEPGAIAGEGGGDGDDDPIIFPRRLNEVDVDDEIDDDEEMDDDEELDQDPIRWPFDDAFEVLEQRRPAVADRGGIRGVDLMDAVLQDDQVDMEINVALDELLGLRGPLSTLVRNLLWLLAFNATYLGIFGFVPKIVGSAVYSTIFNTTVCDKVLKSVPYFHSEDENQTTVHSVLLLVEEESAVQNTTFKLSHFAVVSLGYLSIAAAILLIRNGFLVSRKLAEQFGRNAAAGQAQNQETPAAPMVGEVDQNMGRHMDDEVDDHDAIDGGAGLGISIGVALDATIAIVKVGVLLFFKMFLLPLSLGLWLDLSTIEFFGHELKDRVAFAGGDLFSFLLLHWVAGITFMLLVTVFLLQLREVTHPDILARAIRPQEPQPDLLGNLMHETVATHIKRMLLSFAIYAPLLTLHVSVPVHFFVSSGLGESFTFFHLNFYPLVMPQLEIPLQLIIFHLCMLALLERYKNTIGGFQHRWLKFMCRKMGLTDYILPCSIETFELVGTKPVLLLTDGKSAHQVDPFFFELATKVEGVDEFILSNIDPVDSPMTILGETKESGERVLSKRLDYISLTSKIADERRLLPTRIGRFRLRLEKDSTQPPQTRMEFFREVRGHEIPRPPEGWDDLGAGGAFVQGRWAWAKERKSVVEGGVALRAPLRASPKHRRPLYLVLKVVALVFLSWIAIMTTVLFGLSLPLAVGRSFYHLLRIPEKYIHDPLAFCIGAGLFFPGVSVMSRTSTETEGSILKRFRKWRSRLHLPPTKKIIVAAEAFFLWIVVAPVSLGLSYEVALVKSPKWFAREEPVFDWKSLVISWATGTVLLNTWSFLLYFNVFTRQFWANIGNGILEAPPDENVNANQLANNENQHRARNLDEAEPNHDTNAVEAGNPVAWQGQQGRIAKFFRIWRTVIVDWDWTNVDRALLLEDFAQPVTKQIASALVGSSLSFQLALYFVVGAFQVRQGGTVFPLFGFVEAGVVRKGLFQLCMACHMMIQLASGFRTSIDGWFEAAHDAARDDRYLVGELLMNYNPSNEGSTR